MRRATLQFTRMILAQPVLVPCGLCGAESPQKSTPPVEAQEPPDLDTRPGEPLRSTLPLWMQRCPKCGYCAEDITRIRELAVEVVRSDKYQEQLQDAAYPEKTREFLCHALILDHVKQWADAGWTCLHAAWTCDDAQAELAAERCRSQAIGMWKKSKQHGQAFGDDLAMEFAIVTDVYRRMGKFEMAVVT
ncbi:MAG: hypothetical protein ACRD7E_29135, partial [Bryobacteraceae bacterium]